MNKKEIDILIRKMKSDYIAIHNDNYKTITIKLKEDKKKDVYFQIWSYLPLIFSIFFYQKSIIISVLLLLLFILLRYVDFSSKKQTKLSMIEFDLESKKIIYQNIKTEYKKKIIEIRDVTNFMILKNKINITINSTKTAYYFDIKCETKTNEVKDLFRIIDSDETYLLKKEKALLKFLLILKET